MCRTPLPASTPPSLSTICGLPAGPCAFSSISRSPKSSGRGSFLALATGSRRRGITSRSIGLSSYLLDTTLAAAFRVETASLDILQHFGRERRRALSSGQRTTDLRGGYLQTQRVQTIVGDFRRRRIDRIRPAHHQEANRAGDIAPAMPGLDL